MDAEEKMAVLTEEAEVCLKLGTEEDELRTFELLPQVET